MDEIGYLLLYLCVCIGVSCIFGAITKAINEGKGYYGGFAWGFWLGWIGIIVVACRSSCNYRPTQSIIVPKSNPNLPPQAFSSQPVNGDGWRCNCGRYNPRYVSSCTCGLNKPSTSSVPTHTPSAKQFVPQQNTASTLPADEMKCISLLREYKQLLDDGVITQEEFDQKKKSILSR